MLPPPVKRGDREDSPIDLDQEMGDADGSEAMDNATPSGARSHMIGGRFSVDVPPSGDTWGARTQVPPRHSTCGADYGSSSHDYSHNSGYGRS